MLKKAREKKSIIKALQQANNVNLQAFRTSLNKLLLTFAPFYIYSFESSYILLLLFPNSLYGFSKIMYQFFLQYCFHKSFLTHLYICLYNIIYVQNCSSPLLIFFFFKIEIVIFSIYKGRNIILSIFALYLKITILEEKIVCTLKTIKCILPLPKLV